MKPTGRIPAVGKGGGEEGSKTVVVVQSIENDESAKEGAGGGGGEIAVTISPPISVSKGATLCSDILMILQLLWLFNNFHALDYRNRHSAWSELYRK